MNNQLTPLAHVVPGSLVSLSVKVDLEKVAYFAHHLRGAVIDVSYVDQAEWVAANDAYQSRVRFA